MNYRFFRAGISDLGIGADQGGERWRRIFGVYRLRKSPLEDHRTAAAFGMSMASPSLHALAFWEVTLSSILRLGKLQLVLYTIVTRIHGLEKKSRRIKV